MNEGVAAAIAGAAVSAVAIFIIIASAVKDAQAQTREIERQNKLQQLDAARLGGRAARRQEVGPRPNGRT